MECLLSVFPASGQISLVSTFHSFTNPLNHHHHHHSHSPHHTLLIIIMCTFYVSQRTLVGIVIIERLLNIVKDQLWWLLTIHTAHQILLFVIVNDWHRFRMEHVEALFQRINIVIGSSSATAQASIDTHTIGAFKEQHKLQIDFVLHLLHPTVQIVLVTWKSIDEELILCWISLKKERKN